MKTNRKFILVAILVLVIGLLTASLAFAGEGDSAASWASSAAVGEATGNQGASASGSITLTHSTVPGTIVPGSVACSPDGGASTTENSYWRVYDLTAMGVTGDFDVNTVRFGVENASNSGSTTVNLYTLSGPLNTSNLTLIGTGSFNVADGALFFYDATVAATAPAGSTLVVEISSPDLSSVGAFFIGSNNLGQSAPSYLSSASCGLSQPTDTGAIGFPNFHMLIHVIGNEVIPSVPSIAISKDPASQTIVTGGNADFTITVTNTGDVDLDSVTVVDPLVPACDNAIGTLTVGASNSYSCTDVGVGASYTNVVTVTSLVGTAPGPSATTSATVTVVPPTSVSLSGFSGDSSAFSIVWIVALLVVVAGFGIVLRRKLTA